MRVAGRLVLEDGIVGGRLGVAGEYIDSVEADVAVSDGPIITPGFIDLHIHGWDGHEAMGSVDDLAAMAAALVRHGVTSFLPTAVTAPIERLATFAARVRELMDQLTADRLLGAPDAPRAEPLGFNLEGPFLSVARKGAQDERFIRAPDEVPRSDLEPLLDGWRVTTVAPEVPGALGLIEWLAERGVVVALGHSAADLDTAVAGYAAGARSTTHLFNAMSGFDHVRPGLAAAALATDDAWVELIADGKHVHPYLWPAVVRTKPDGRLLLVSDAIASDDPAGLAAGARLAGSRICLDTAVRNLVNAGVRLHVAAAAASRNPAQLLGAADRGRLVRGQRADLVELNDQLVVQRVMVGGRWAYVA